MSEQRDAAADIEQRYVGEHVETEQVLTGLDPEATDEGAKEQVEALADGERSADEVEKMSRDDP